MIETIWVENPQIGETLELTLRTSLDQEGLLIFNMTGLGSAKASYNGSAGPSYRGIRVSSTTTDARHIILTLAVPGRGDMEEEARAKVYKFFPTNQEIVLRVYSGGVYLEADMYVESVEFNHFAKVENAEISLLGPDSYFRHVLKQEREVGYLDGTPIYEFPHDDPGGFEVGVQDGITVSRIDYAGIETGVELIINILSNIDDFTITNSNGEQLLTCSVAAAETHFGITAGAGDYIHIDTRYGRKAIDYVHDGERYSMFNSVIFNNDSWISLRPGSNYVDVDATPAATAVQTTVRYQVLVEGV